MCCFGRLACQLKVQPLERFSASVLCAFANLLCIIGLHTGPNLVCPFLYLCVSVCLMSMLAVTSHSLCAGSLSFIYMSELFEVVFVSLI